MPEDEITEAELPDVEEDYWLLFNRAWWKRMLERMGGR